MFECRKIQGRISPVTIFLGCLCVWCGCVCGLSVDRWEVFVTYYAASHLDDVIHKTQKREGHVVPGCHPDDYPNCDAPDRKNAMEKKDIYATLI